ncbi:unnamed protein product [Blepharisma stoltei]|uniref:Uncharacterized protein n=1 Tax=Blepharisma stoltei TaxID=1481888 RepID=A0AAU9JJT4_9CILI|nr:unnamed protein product [Blepharisma stoltei]
MGCCSSRAMNKLEISKMIHSYIIETRLDAHNCSSIKRLDVQILEETIDAQTYESLAKGWDIKAPFELFSKGNKIFKKDLKIAFLLFSRDSFEKKAQLFKELTKSDKREIIHLLEIRNELLYMRIPTQLAKQSKISDEDKNEYVESKRLVSGKEASHALQSCLHSSEEESKRLDFISI